MKKNITASQYEREQKKYLKILMEEIKDQLNCKLEKALKSGAIPEEWKKEGSYLLPKAVINSFCKDMPYAHLTPKIKKESDNLHLFL